MAKSRGRCKVCGHTVSVGSSDTPPGIAAEGVMEGIQDHIFREHCDDDFNLIEGDYDGVGNAWEHV